MQRSSNWPSDVNLRSVCTRPSCEARTRSPSQTATVPSSVTVSGPSRVPGKKVICASVPSSSGDEATRTSSMSGRSAYANAVPPGDDQTTQLAGAVVCSSVTVASAIFVGAQPSASNRTRSPS